MDGSNSDPLDFGALVTFYERVVDPLTMPVGIAALDLAGVSAGTKLIDVAAGTGAVAGEAARRGGHVSAIDIEPKMVARAAERLIPFDGCEARVGDFKSLDAADGTFDAAISVVGVLAFRDGEQGLRELVRVTRSGGTVAVATWDQEQPASPQQMAFDVFGALFPDRRLWPEGFFPAWPKQAVVTALKEAGCITAAIHEVSGEWRVDRPANVMEDSGASVRKFPGYNALDDNERKRFEAGFVAAVAAKTGADGIARLPMRAFVVLGRLPD